MKKLKTSNLRALVQAIICLALIAIVTIYNLYVNGQLSFKILSIGDMNPYGGWSAVHEYTTNSFYEFQGITRSIALTTAILIMAIIGGRFFCGWLCPLGAIQDLTSWLGRKFNITRYRGFNIRGIAPVFIKYFVLLAVLLASILGFGSIVAGLSPWRALLSLPKLSTEWVEMKVAFIILFSTLIASVFISRFFCRYFCPLGAVQALFSSFNAVKIEHSKGCSSCSRCIKECPVGIEFTSDNNTVSPECIRCLNCVDDCKITEENRRVNISLKSRLVSKKTYITMMLLLFIIIWIGLPKILGGKVNTEDILLGSLRDGTYEGEAKGFARKIVTEVKIADGKIIEIDVIDHSESKGWYEEVFMTLPKEIIKKQRLSVDVISGATKSSKGLIYSVENAIRKAMNAE